MSQINVYGCSWSHGILENNFDSWVTEISKLLPEYKINNYALQGSSIAFSCWMLEKTFDTNAINIFQCTMPGRFSSWNEFDIKRYQFQKTDNVVCFSDDIPVERILANIGNKKYKKFVNEYYAKLTEPLEIIEWKAYIEFAKKRSTYIFTHRPHEVNCHLQNIDNIGNILGIKKYKEYTDENDGFHFGPSGMKWQADFIVDKLSSKGIL